MDNTWTPACSLVFITARFHGAPSKTWQKLIQIQNLPQKKETEPSSCTKRCEAALSIRRTPPRIHYGDMESTKNTKRESYVNWISIFYHLFPCSISYPSCKYPPVNLILQSQNRPQGSFQYRKCQGCRYGHRPASSRTSVQHCRCRFLHLVLCRGNSQV